MTRHARKHRQTRKNRTFLSKTSKKDVGGSRRWFTTKNPLNGVLSMQSFWETIQEHIEKRKLPLKCVFCHSSLNPSGKELSDLFEYRTVINPAETKVTKSEKIMVRKYNLPSALRSTNPMMHHVAAIGGGKRSGGTLFQPTIFYFHCPYCGFLHQFKSSVKLSDPMRQRQHHYDESRRRHSDPTGQRRKSQGHKSLRSQISPSPSHGDHDNPHTPLLQRSSSS